MESPLSQQIPIVTTDAPVSKLSGADIAQPYQSLANGLDNLGQGIDAVAVKEAEKAGAKAVTRDADGNIQVEKAPIFGAAGEAYTRAVKIGALAEADGAAQRADIELRTKYRDDPQGYLTAADAFRKKQIANMSAAAGPEVGVALGRVIDRTTTQTYKGLLNEKERLDLQRADGAITAGINSASDDAIALARQGVPLDSRDMQGLLGKYTTLLDEKLKNPRLAYTQEQHDLDIQQFQGQLAGARNLYHVDQVYKDQSSTEKTLPDGTKVQEPNGGYAKAVEAAKDILTNPDYKLTPAQRQGFYSHAMGEIRANEAIRRQDLGEARTAFRELSTAAQLGQRINPDEVENVANAFRASNYPAGVAQVYASFAHKDLHDDFGRLPLSQQSQEMNTIRGAAAAKQAYQFFVGKGYRPEEAAGIVGNLVHESGLNPGATHDIDPRTGQPTGLGIAGFRLERRDALRQFAADRGKPATDFQTQLEFVDQELRTSEAPTRAALSRAATPEQAAAAFINYERPQGYDPNNLSASHGYQNRVNLARSIFHGLAVDGSGGPGVQSWLIANRSATVDDAATKSWKQVMDDWSAGKGGPPSDARANEIIDAARSTGNVDLLTKISRDMDVIDKVQRISQLPISQQVQTEVELRRRQANGTANAGAEMIEKQLTARTTAIQKGLEDNPVATAISNFPDKFKTPPPLDLSSPDNLVGGLKMRAQIAQVAAENWQTGPLSALDSQDIAQAKAALQNPDPAVKAGIYGAISQLPEDVRNATLKKLGGNDPKSMVEAAAGSMMAVDPSVAASIFRGQSAIATDKSYLPKGDSETASFDQEFSKQLPVSTFSLAARTDPAGPYATAQGMIQARYADLSAQSSDTSGKFNTARLQRAVDDVTGGVLEHNGGKLIAPQRGMPQAAFDRVIYGLTDADLSAATTLHGEQITAGYLRDRATLESVGDGRYYVKLGNDAGKPIYAYQGANSEAPLKFVLDLRNRLMGSAPQPMSEAVP
jgi:hypothetical protein